MRQISKGAEPNSLTEHRAAPHSSYANYQDKGTLRAALVAEQRGLCCYCMGRISAEQSKMKIEHWQCVARYPHEQLNYRNLLGACMGGEGKESGVQHCDTKKADRDLRWNPADPEHRIEMRIGYGADGTIQSKDTAFDRQLNDVLNLNIRHIKNARKEAHNGVAGWWRSRKRRNRAVSRSRLEAEIRKRSDVPVMDAYSPVAIWWLKRRLARMGP